MFMESQRYTLVYAYNSGKSTINNRATDILLPM
jgi:hypothetical protein